MPEPYGLLVCVCVCAVYKLLYSMATKNFYAAITCQYFIILMEPNANVIVVYLV